MSSLAFEAAAGRRLSPDEGLRLLEDGDLLELGLAASELRRRLLGDGPATFLVDRNINYTNVCLNRCRFCAFFRDEESAEAFLLSEGEVLDKVADAVRRGATQIMLQGGLHPALSIDYFLNIFENIKSHYPVHLHSLSPPEISFLASRSELSLKEVISQLVSAGLDSLPGGGAEILVDGVRNRISPHKIKTSRWLEVMETAHSLGMPTTATMMFGAGETRRDRIDHLLRLRDLQDRTGGFISFIPWTFQPGNSELGGEGISSLEYLRTLATSRLFLDNFPHLQGSWVTQGREIGQLSLEFGADDLGSIMLEENVVKAAGTSHSLTLEEMVRTIQGARRRCAQRDTRFRLLRTFEELP